MTDTTQAADAAQSITSEVEVSVSPEVAFTAFTDELDLWWVRGPINHWNAGRMRELRCEPGVGGRLLEVYTDDDALELGRITEWAPGERLAWRSSVDDVATEVRFEPAGGGTRVRVIATIPAGGQDRGGTSWTRTVPRWFGDWCERRDAAPHEVRDLARLALAVAYARPAAAAHWLADVFGFASPDPLPDGPDPLPEEEHGHPWIEFRIGTSSLIISRREGDGPTDTTTLLPWVYVTDIDAHHATAVSGGATIVEPLTSGWGLPMYTAEDLEGHRWTFAQARPTM